MNRWRFLLGLLMLLLAAGSSPGHARKFVNFKHGVSIMREKVLLPLRQIRAPGLRLPSPSFVCDRCAQAETTTEVQDVQSVSITREKVVLPLRQIRARGLRRPSSSFVCDTCMDISAFAEQVLTNPDTMGNVLDYLNGSLCKALPNFQEQCTNLAEIYVPNLVETLEVYAAPDKLCEETKLCPSTAMRFVNDMRTCKVCTDFAAEALSYAKDNKTEQEIMSAIHGQCAKLGAFRSRCDKLVDTYGPVYMDKLDSTTAEQVCEKVGMCTGIAIKDPSDCATCEFVMYQLKNKLHNPTVQAKVLDLLVGSCSKMPKNYLDQCEELVNQYVPIILDNLDLHVNPEAICTEIHACESKTKLSVDVLIQPRYAHEGVAHQ